MSKNKTERQVIVQHFADKKMKFQTTVDMAVYLARDLQQTRPQLADQKPYVEKVLKAGYKSTMAKDLFDDINKATPDENPGE